MPRCTYCESVEMVTTHGFRKARRPSMTACSSMRLLVVRSSQPYISPVRPPKRSTHAHPPGPGFPIHDPSMDSLTCFRAVTAADSSCTLVLTASKICERQEAATSMGNTPNNSNAGLSANQHRRNRRLGFASVARTRVSVLTNPQPASHFLATSLPLYRSKIILAKIDGRCRAGLARSLPLRPRRFGAVAGAAVAPTVYTVASSSARRRPSFSYSSKVA